MASSSPSGPTFSLDVSSEGAASLRNTVMKKLSEFMGSYTDDVLAEYVVVLVGHGKHQAQAVKDLEAFLGDQSEAFVAWLWDYLESNIHMYTSIPEVSLPKPSLADGEQLLQAEEDKLEKHEFSDTQKVPVEKSSVSRGGRVIRLKKDFVKDNDSRSRMENALLSEKEQPILSSGELDSDRTPINRGRNSTHRSKRAHSPDSIQPSKRNATYREKKHLSPPRVNAPRRLLQSAVREAVTGVSKRLMPSNRLRSIVSTNAEYSESASVRQPVRMQEAQPVHVQDPLKDPSRGHAIRQDRRAKPAIMMAMKAAAAAAEDVTKARGRTTANIWDRLGKSSAEGVGNKEHEHARHGHANEVVESRFVGASQHHYEEREESGSETGGRVSEDSAEEYDTAASDLMNAEYSRQLTGERTILPVRGGKYEVTDRDKEGSVRNVSYEEDQPIRSSDKLERSREESVTVEYRLAQNRERAGKDQREQKSSNLSARPANSSQKIVNISVNVNTWKPEQYGKENDAEDGAHPSASPMLKAPINQTAASGLVDTAKETKGCDEELVTDQHSSGAKWHTREVHPETSNQSAKQTDSTKESQKVNSSTLPVSGAKQGRKSQDDAVTRTVFVTNIHFAATKESVTAHFAPCGDISRIVMLSDGATGLPKGSAYIEFKTKDAADKALGLNESSFYSRILKVVRKNEAIQAIQVTNPLVRPALIRRPIPLALHLPIRGRFLRGSPYVLPRFPSMPRPYGNFPSLQWKRDTATAGATSNTPLPNATRPILPTRPARSLSYVRNTSTSVQQNPGTSEEQSTPSQQGENNKIKPDQLNALAEDQKGDYTEMQLD